MDPRLQDATRGRLRLLELGYSPVPCEGKRPVIKGWQYVRADAGAIESWASRYPTAINTGILGAHTPGLDLDLRDDSAVKIAWAISKDRFRGRGRLLRRRGQSPKILIPLGTDEPFKKLRNSFVGDHANEGIEVLGDGQQYIVHGIHPETGQPYVWLDDEILDVPRSELPLVTETTMRDLVDEIIEAVVQRRGYILSAGRRPAKTAKDDDSRDLVENTADKDRIRAALDVIPSDDYDDWVRVGFALWNELGDEGLDLFYEWSRKSEKYEEGRVRQQWEESKKSDGRVTTGTIFHLAQEHDPGWRARHNGGGNMGGGTTRPPLSPQDEIVPPEFSEGALAATFVDRHEHELRYVAERGKWLRYNGILWKIDNTLEVFSMAHRVCLEAAREANPPTLRKALASAKTRAAVVSLAAENRRIAASGEGWDSDPMLLNTPGGTVDLCTGEMREHRVSDYVTKMTTVTPGGDAPRWRRFINEITGGNAKFADYLQRLVGYCLTGLTTEQVFAFFHGSGQNGKGTFLNTLIKILGDYACTTAAETFTASKYDRHPTELARLRNVRLVVSSETEANHAWAESRIKMLTGGDPVTARYMRQDFFEFQPQFKIIMMGQHLPTLRGVDKAISRRLHRVPFLVTIPDSQRDDKLAEKLKGEHAGILQWAIEGCLEWQQRGLNPPSIVTEATETYLADEDWTWQWIDSCCIRAPGLWTSTRDLYDSFYAWAQRARLPHKSINNFSQDLANRGFKRVRHNKMMGFADIAVARVEPEPREDEGRPHEDLM